MAATNANVESTTVKDGASLTEKRLEPTHEEVEKWLDFVFEVFPSTGREYFARHLREDPRTDYDFIFVLYQQDTIVSTVRVFLRKVYLDRQVYNVGGIGEVSTKASFRGAGLASRLLKRTFEEMPKKEMFLSTLHAGGKAMPMYERLGYKSYPRTISHFSVTLDALRNAADAINRSSIKELDFDIDSDVQRVMELHWSFNTQLNFNGWFVRDDINYWKKWVKAESSKFLVLTDSNNVIQGFFCAKIYKRLLQKEEALILVKDFAIDLTNGDLHYRDLLFEFCSRWLLLQQDVILKDGPIKTLEVMIPSPIVTSQEYIKSSSSSEASSPAGLYQRLPDHVDNSAFFKQFVSAQNQSLDLERVLEPSSHLFWSTDDF
eukprot:TRINITY_DN6688_c0_g1_i2.p1 TRINITY_DN6688_c0_g1~~TRINITY_DN6688_c0_g1_i2.p1  ORF type:complete len:375 (-),score=72.34 TRINITY_DN6688_c0_g1_i2:133-1257(-)